MPWFKPLLLETVIREVIVLLDYFFSLLNSEKNYVSRLMMSKSLDYWILIFSDLADLHDYELIADSLCCCCFASDCWWKVRNSNMRSKSRERPKEVCFPTLVRSWWWCWLQFHSSSLRFINVCRALVLNFSSNIISWVRRNANLWNGIAKGIDLFVWTSALRLSYRDRWIHTCTIVF